MAAPRLLVVDDTPEIALIVRWLARAAGHEVAACGDAAAAWELLRIAADASRLPDLVLLDVHLPRTPGPELCRRLRATPGLAGLPVAVFAHEDRGDDLAAGLAAGADFAVCKDLLARPEAWAARLGELLAWRQGRAAELFPSCIGLQASADEVFRAVNAALRGVLPRPAGPAVLPVLAERGLQTLSWWEHASGEGRKQPPRPQPLTAVPDGWLLPGGLGLDPGRLAPVPQGAVLVFALALVDQVGCVVGTAAAAPLRAALAGAVPGLGKALSH